MHHSPPPTPRAPPHTPSPPPTPHRDPTRGVLSRRPAFCSSGGRGRMMGGGTSVVKQHEGRRRKRSEVTCSLVSGWVGRKIPQNKEALVITGVMYHGGRRSAELVSRCDSRVWRQQVISQEQQGWLDHNRKQMLPVSRPQTLPAGLHHLRGPAGICPRPLADCRGEGTHGGLCRNKPGGPKSNPTIGIAYPQQKAVPHRRAPGPRPPVNGSYRFHVPRIPEREAELQKEDIGHRQRGEAPHFHARPPVGKCPPLPTRTAQQQQQHDASPRVFPDGRTQGGAFREELGSVGHVPHFRRGATAATPWGFASAGGEAASSDESNLLPGVVDTSLLAQSLQATLNGLGYHTDDGELDSSFIEAFADEDAPVPRRASDVAAAAALPQPPESTAEVAAMDNDVGKGREETSPTATAGRGRASRHRGRRGRGKDMRQLYHTSRRSKKKQRRGRWAALPTGKRNGYNLTITTPVTCVPTTPVYLRRDILAPSPDSASSPLRPHHTSSHDVGGATGGGLGDGALDGNTCGKDGLGADMVESLGSRPEKPLPSVYKPIAHRSIKHVDVLSRRGVSGRLNKELIHKIVLQKNNFYKVRMKPWRSPLDKLKLVLNIPKSVEKDQPLSEYDYISDTDTDYDPMGAKGIKTDLREVPLKQPIAPSERLNIASNTQTTTNFSLGKNRLQSDTVQQSEFPEHQKESHAWKEQHNEDTELGMATEHCKHDGGSCVSSGEAAVSRQEESQPGMDRGSLGGICSPGLQGGPQFHEGASLQALTSPCWRLEDHERWSDAVSCESGSSRDDPTQNWEPGAQHSDSTRPLEDPLPAVSPGASHSLASTALEVFDLGGSASPQLPFPPGGHLGKTAAHFDAEDILEALQLSELGERSRCEPIEARGVAHATDIGQDGSAAHVDTLSTTDAMEKEWSFLDEMSSIFSGNFDLNQELNSNLAQPLLSHGGKLSLNIESNFEEQTDISSTEFHMTDTFHTPPLVQGSKIKNIMDTIKNITDVEHLKNTALHNDTCICTSESSSSSSNRSSLGEGQPAECRRGKAQSPESVVAVPSDAKLAKTKPISFLSPVLHCDFWTGDFHPFSPCFDEAPSPSPDSLCRSLVQINEDLHVKSLLDSSTLEHSPKADPEIELMDSIVKSVESSYAITKENVEAVAQEEISHPNLSMLTHNSDLRWPHKQPVADIDGCSRAHIAQLDSTITTTNISQVCNADMATTVNSSRPAQPELSPPQCGSLSPCTPVVENTAQAFVESLFQFNELDQIPAAATHESSGTEMDEPLPPGFLEGVLRELADEIKTCSRGRHEPTVRNRDKQYKCRACFQWFLTLGELDFHKLSHIPAPPPTCYMCVQRKFSSREQLREHLREKHCKQSQQRTWSCGMCLKELSDMWMYNEHLREHAAQFSKKGQVHKMALMMAACNDEYGARDSDNDEERGPKPQAPPLPAGALPEPVAGTGVDATSVSPGQGPSGAREGPATKVATAGPEQEPEQGPKQGPEQGPACELAAARIPAGGVHPDCKDPSRDCHHCGKQFPKPFKLQRHLVVHSLQRAHVCQLCPVVFLDASDLRAHLGAAHGVDEEEAEVVRHVTIYDCEQCADVMHVIKKSFICSACNYTFSKKEQFDRHMDKHLTAGGAVRAFRRAVRPRELPRANTSSRARTMDCGPRPKSSRSSSRTGGNITEGTNTRGTGTGDTSPGGTGQGGSYTLTEGTSDSSSAGCTFMKNISNSHGTGGISKGGNNTWAAACSTTSSYNRKSSPDKPQRGPKRLCDSAGPTGGCREAPGKRLKVAARAPKPGHPNQTVPRHGHHLGLACGGGGGNVGGVGGGTGGRGAGVGNVTVSGSGNVSGGKLNGASGGNVSGTFSGTSAGNVNGTSSSAGASGDLEDSRSSVGTLYTAFFSSHSSSREVPGPHRRPLLDSLCGGSRTGGPHTPRPRPALPASCKSAQSQRDLLNQMFGHRLTTFKIPLRKECKEQLSE
ncbi:unnamed protein product [Lampetra planeri]